MKIANPKSRSNLSIKNNYHVLEVGLVMGYLETPSIIGEFLILKESHKWVIQEIDSKIVMYEKDKIGFHVNQDMGCVFQKYLPKNSIGFKLMDRTLPSLAIVNYEWKNNIEVLVNPDSSYYKDFSTKPFTAEMCEKLYPKKPILREFSDTVGAFGSILKSVLKSKWSSS